MQEQKIITGKTEDEIWQKIKADLSNQDVLEYAVVIEYQDRRVLLDIDIDLGGGFESGYSTTILRSSLQPEDDFRFAIHKEGFLDDVGKFFGMQDVEIGYAEFDKKLIIKTNNEERVKKIFSDKSAREVFKSLNDFTLSITQHSLSNSEKKDRVLELIIEEGITDSVRLRMIYRAFFNTLLSIEPVVKKVRKSRKKK